MTSNILAVGRAFLIAMIVLAALFVSTMPVMAEDEIDLDQMLRDLVGPIGSITNYGYTDTAVMYAFTVPYGSDKIADGKCVYAEVRYGTVVPTEDNWDTLEVARLGIGNYRQIRSIVDLQPDTTYYLAARNMVRGELMPLSPVMEFKTLV